MTDLSSFFLRDQTQHLDLSVPLPALRVMQVFADIIGDKDISIGGGFVRGLYMQQVLGLTPQMNDIDIFAALPTDRFLPIRKEIEALFGSPSRFHIGQFEKEPYPRGLIEFPLPENVQKSCAGAKSIQLNFGESHPYANPHQYILDANLGINQIAITPEGKVIASPSFIKDMHAKTITMNPNRDWAVSDWARTVQSIQRMQGERPEFKGWQAVLRPKPRLEVSGSFWDRQTSFFAEHTPE